MMIQGKATDTEGIFKFISYDYLRTVLSHSLGCNKCSYRLRIPWTSPIKVPITLNGYLLFRCISIRFQICDDRDYISVVYQYVSIVPSREPDRSQDLKYFLNQSSAKKVCCFLHHNRETTDNRLFLLISIETKKSGYIFFSSFSWGLICKEGRSPEVDHYRQIIWNNKIYLLIPLRMINLHQWTELMSWRQIQLGRKERLPNLVWRDRKCYTLQNWLP